MESRFLQCTFACCTASLLAVWWHFYPYLCVSGIGEHESAAPDQWTRHPPKCSQCKTRWVCVIPSVIPSAALLTCSTSSNKTNLCIKSILVDWTVRKRSGLYILPTRHNSFPSFFPSSSWKCKKILAGSDSRVICPAFCFQPDSRMPLESPHAGQEGYRPLPIASPKKLVFIL